MGIAAKRGTIAKLVYNMMDIKVLNSDGSVSDDTLSNSVHNSDSVKGQVVAVFGTSLDNESHEGLNKYQIAIAAGSTITTYSIEELSDSIKNNISDYLGKLVIAYYEEESGQSVYDLNNLVLQQNRNKVLDVNDSDIESYTETEVKYYDSKSDSTKSFGINSDAYILYNGKASGKSVEELISELQDNGGKITFLDSSGGSSADVVFIQTYVNIYVSSIDAVKYKIYDKYDTTRTFVLDPTDKSKKIEFKKGGTAAQFKDIKLDDVVSVAESEDGKLYTVLISSESTRGSVTETYSDDERKIQISGKVYSIAASYQKYMDENSSQELNVGTTATFRIDALGKLAAATIDAAKSYTYGYLVELEAESGSEDYLEAKIYPITTSTLSSIILKFDDNVELNGETYKGDSQSGIDSIIDVFETDAPAMNKKVDSNDDGDYDDNSDVNYVDDTVKYAQIVKYTTNSSGMIDKIFTNSSGVSASSDDTNNLKVVDLVNKIGGKYSSSTIDDKYTVNSSTKIIKIPNDRYENNYKKISLSSGSTYRMQLIDVDSVNKAQVVLVYGVTASSQSLSASTRPVIVTEVSTKYIDSENVRAITVVNKDGTEATYYEDDDSDVSFDNISVGDIIRIAADGENFVYDIDDTTPIKPSALEAYDKTAGNSSGTSSAEYKGLVGTALRMQDNSLVVLPLDDALPPASDSGATTDGEQAYASIANAKVWLVDLNANNKVTSARKEDIIPYKSQPDSASKIFVYSYYGTVELIVIFKNYTLAD